MDQKLLEALDDGAVLVTGNRRLARALQDDHARHQQSAGRVAWATPTILPWSAWLISLWQGSHAERSPRTLLDVTQMRLVWERVIRESGIGEGLLGISSTAAQVADAWQLARDWEIEIPAPDEPVGEDARAFGRWARRFEQQCGRHGWLDEARLPTALAERIQRDQLILPITVILAGFDELTPQQQRLLNAMTRAGVTVSRHEPAGRNQSAERLVLADEAAELAHAAAWARDCLQADPAARVGVVVGDLASQRRRVMRVFADILHPGRVLPGQPHRERAFNVSLGPPLASYPLVRGAFNILRLMAGVIDCNELGTLLRSPYLEGGLAEADARARLDARLRRRGEREIWLSDLLGMARAQTDAADQAVAPHFVSLLQRLFVHHRESAGRQQPGAWAARFSQCLTAAGWPGERPLTSEEFQITEAWGGLLDRFASLDPVAEPMAVKPALARLQRMATELPFQPRQPDRPIQVLGPLEAAGQTFDYLRVVGVDDERWPAPARPNPWLPLHRQRQADMPHATPARELDYARRQLARLQDSATHLVASHPARREDRAIGPSPLIRHWPVRESPAHDSGLLDFRDLVHACQATESFRDDRVPGFPAGPADGGTGMLASQSACPFQAVARYRLGARALEEPRTGPDARDRGQLVHQALERLWRQLGDQRTLLSRDSVALEGLIADVVADAVERLARRRPRTYTDRLKAVEADTLQRLLRTWLAQEQQRPPFTVAAREQPRTIELAGLSISLRLDRVDRLADGSHLVIDYKTGRIAGNSFLDGDRPDQPQLPVYALVADTPVTGVLAARVRADDPGFCGMVCGDEGPAGAQHRSAEDWARQLDNWQVVLTRLATAFREGDAAVDPKNGSATCRTCDLATLCRIHEAGTGEDDPEAAEAGA